MRRFLWVLPLFLIACMQVTWTAVTPTIQASDPVPTPTQTPVAILRPTVTQAAVSCVVSTGIADGMLHLRTCGSIDCQVLEWLPEGKSVKLVTQGQSGWSQVKTEKHTGFVNNEYLECKK